jgi:hypothetical protein
VDGCSVESPIVPDARTVDAGLWAYPWDLADEGWDESLSLIAGLGVRTLRVAASYHGLQGYFPHNARRRVLRADAAVYFSPDRSLYAGTSLKPVLSPLIPQIGEIRELAERAHAAALRVVAWTVCLHNAILAAAHPDCAQLNVYGERHAGALCPANPDARRYIVALTRDLAQNQGVDGIELEAAHFFRWLHHAHPKVGTPLGATGDVLLSLCVCPHCLAAGAALGADGDEVARFARAVLDRVAASEPSDELSLPTLCQESPDLDGFMTARRATVASLLREVCEAVQVPVFYFAPADDLVTGIDWQAVSRLAQILELPAYVPSAEEARALLLGRIERTGVSARHWTLGLSALAPECTSRQQLLEVTDAVLDEGATGIAIYNYGLIPPARLDWVRDAISRATARSQMQPPAP